MGNTASERCLEPRLSLPVLSNDLKNGGGTAKNLQNTILCDIISVIYYLHKGGIKNGAFNKTHVEI